MVEIFQRPEGGEIAINTSSIESISKSTMDGQIMTLISMKSGNEWFVTDSWIEVLEFWKKHSGE